MATINISRISNDDLITETKKAAAAERESTVKLVTLLAEVDARRLYPGQGCSSLFAWCTSVLHLSEHATYLRIEAARAARKFPVILDRLAEGAVTLTSIGLLRPHLTATNHVALLDAARHQSKREVERLVAGVAPKADAPSMLRRLPVVKPLSTAPPDRQPSAADGVPSIEVRSDPAAAPLAMEIEKATRDAPVRPPSADDRYLLRLTIGGETLVKFQRARDLLRHTIPSGDAGAIVDRALTVLVEQLERTKFAATPRPRPSRHGRNERAEASESRERRAFGHNCSELRRGPQVASETSADEGGSGAHGVPALQHAQGALSSSKDASERAGGPRGEAPGSRNRHVPAAVRRTVWARDGGRCAFVGAEGRCRETGRLEFHHLIPHARGGRTDTSNLALRCRAHSAYEGRLEFGDRSRTRSGPS